MVAAFKQIVKVQAGGVIRLRSKELRAGDEAEVIVLIPERAPSRHSKNGKGRRAKEDGFPVAQMTKQVRGDIAEANRARKAIREGREKLIPWEQVKRELGLK